MGRKKKEQQQESLKQNPVNETPEDGDSAEYEEMPDQSEQIMQTGSVTVTKAKHVIHCLTIVGQIEGHYILPPQNKTTKYEHVIPQLVAIEQDPSIEGLMIILNTVGGDVEAGLAIAELIAGMTKPTVSIVLGGSHSIGVPLAVAPKVSMIVPSASMTIHPVRMNGTVIAAPQTFNYFERIQERIVSFVAKNSRIGKEKFLSLMLKTGEMAADVGSVIYGEEAVALGAFKAGVIPISDVSFERSFRDMCESNACGNYGRCWMCPPNVGNIDTLMDQARSYDRVLVYQTVSPLEDSYDFEGMMAAAHRHSLLSRQLDQLCAREAPADYLHLGAGGCHVCVTCAKVTGEPCRHPDLAMASLEAYGVNVSELAAASGMKYINGQNTVTYFGAVLFKER